MGKMGYAQRAGARYTSQGSLLVVRLDNTRAICKKGGHLPMAQQFHLSNVVLLTGFVFFAFPGDALAYLDPGTGSLATQMLVASLAGFAFVLKSQWRRVRLRLHHLLSRGKGCVPDGRDVR